MSELDQAYAACLRLAKSHYENFPVASRLMPKALRPHVAAIYAFARIADDYADEPGYTTEQRLELLTEWRRRLHRAIPGQQTSPGSSALPDHIFAALGHTAARFELPVSLFNDLLDAFVQDV